MKKAILLSASLFILAISMNSCKKCYMCTLNQQSHGASGADTTIILKSEICNKGKEGAGANVKVAISDEERNGYICQPE